MLGKETAYIEVSLLLAEVCKTFNQTYDAVHCAQVWERIEPDENSNWFPSLCCHGNMTHVALFDEATELVRAAHPLIQPRGR